MIRSRCKLIEENERPTKYFLNLEKASQNIRHIRSLKIGNEVSFDPDRILDQQKSYYSNLYTEKDCYMNTNDKYYETIKNSIPKISLENKVICDMEIKFEEVTTVVKALKNNKSPGPDGFTAEFYKFFWDDIGPVVYQTYKDAFLKGSLIGTQNEGA